MPHCVFLHAFVRCHITTHPHSPICLIPRVPKLTICIFIRVDVLLFLCQKGSSSFTTLSFPTYPSTACSSSPVKYFFLLSSPSPLTDSTKNSNQLPDQNGWVRCNAAAVFYQSLLDLFSHKYDREQAFALPISSCALWGPELNLVHF